MYYSERESVLRRVSVFSILPQPTQTTVVIKVISDNPQPTGILSNAAFLALIGVVIGATISFAGQWLLAKYNYTQQLKRDRALDIKNEIREKKAVTRQSSKEIIKIARSIKTFIEIINNAREIYQEDESYKNMNMMY